MNPVKITKEAQMDLFDIWYYIASEQQSPQNADTFIDEIHLLFLKLSQSPFIGLRKPELHPDVYQFPLKSYLIFYRPMENGIEVVRVLHGARTRIDLM